MRLGALFSEHMILQRDKEVRVFGETEAATIIRVEVDGISREEKVEGGRFVITLPPHPVGGPYTMTVTDLNDGDNPRVIRDVYYGEVWIANGQSNIEFEIQNARGGEKELSTAKLPFVRCFKCIKTPVIDEGVLENELHQAWYTCEDGHFRDMSGVGYFFAKKLYADLNVPIGMIDCYQGGTSISCWLSEERLEKYPEGRIYREEFEAAVEGQTEDDYNRLLLEYNRLVSEYQERERAAKAKNPDITPEELSAQAGDYPWPPPMGLKSAFRPSGLYHTMLERIMPVAARGLLYYQGEEDSGKASGYCTLLTELIDEFRKDFRDAELPVFILQLPMFISRNTEDTRDWGYLREAQDLAVRSAEGVTLVPLIDLGEFDNVHPVDKKSPGERTEEEVLCRVYRDQERGHIYAEFAGADLDGNRAVLRFRDTYGALQLKKNELIDLRKETEGDDEGHIYGLEVRLSGSGEWVVPKSFIDKDRVVLEADAAIEGIRYGFFNYGRVNLYNQAGLPVAPFRWEMQ